MIPIKLLHAPDDGGSAAPAAELAKPSMADIAAKTGGNEPIKPAEKPAEKPADKPPGPEAYRPNVPDPYKGFFGKDDRETIDKLSTQLVKTGLPPEKPDLYKLELSEDFTKRFGKMEQDPAVALWRDIAHKNGVSDKAFNGIISDLYSGLIDKGMMDKPVDGEAEMRKLADPKAAPDEQVIQGAKRYNDLAANFNELVSKGVLKREETNLIFGKSMTAESVMSLEKAIKYWRGDAGGIKVGGQGQQGVTAESIAQQRREPRYFSSNKEYDPAFRARVDRDHRALHGAK